MRLHRLSVTAFGPFVETATVDFDALAESGLFLLSGATGSGKSSVLDAVCFALYAAVPGDRQLAGRLRSDQAPPTLAPEVTVEVTLGDRRFLIIRSPTWRRPKKRGAGTTLEQARVTVSERRGDEWVHLTSRLDEAGDLLSGLLGMNLDQFCQVALLPQGHFQAFLRAKPDDRQRLLARLFRTGRFERVEAWLREHRLTLRRESHEHAQVVTDLVSRLSESAATPVPHALADVAVAAGDGSLAEWAGGLRADAAARRATAEEALGSVTGRERLAREAWEGARSLSTARARVAEAASVLEELEHTEREAAADRERVMLARRAEGVRPLVRLRDERRRAHHQARTATAASLESASAAGIDVDDLPGELDHAVGSLARLVALIPAERQLAELREREDRTVAGLARLDDEEQLLAARSTSLTARMVTLEHEVEQATVSADSLGAAERAVHAAELVTTAHEQLDVLVPERELALDAHAAATRRLLDARERLLDLRERRIAGMAAELAGALAVGDDCPVCGSADHPRLATAASGHPDAATEREVQRDVDDAQIAEHALALRVRDLDNALATARHTAGATDAAEARERVSAARADLADLRARADRHTRLQQQLVEARAESVRLDAEAARHGVRRAELATTLTHVRSEAERLSTNVAEARGDRPSLDDVVMVLEARRDLVRRVLADTTRCAAAADALDQATTALVRAALEAGFDDPAEAEAAELSTAELDQLEERVRERDAAAAAAREVLDEPAAFELLTTPEPDVAGLEGQHRLLAAAAQQAQVARDHAVRVDERLGDLTGELDAALDAWAPVRERLAVATAVSAFCEGKAPDNRLQMRLSAYVLAHRLSQVVAAANVRLATMSDQRYSLEHVGRRGAREARGGLSLVVRDDWSGESRDPATLSGGETFVVSLALALGLADVVTSEAGGAELQTLFVDEGFGALDAETLDDVLDILDTLRENGRCVGVVSHVAEMRDRIPTQLVVRKARSGSTLSLRT